MQDRRRLLRTVDRLLQDEYGSPRHGNFYEPTDELVFLLLTIQTRIADARPYYSKLRRAYRPWDALADASERDVFQLIAPLGLGKQRARYLVQVARRVRADHGFFSLRWLKHVPEADALDYLRSLPSVGEKVARCVGIYSLDSGLSPMDINATRILSRVGVLPRSVTSKTAHEWMDRLCPSSITYRLHVNLVAHGQTCGAVARCKNCRLHGKCRFANTGW